MSRNRNVYFHDLLPKIRNLLPQRNNSWEERKLSFQGHDSLPKIGDSLSQRKDSCKEREIFYFHDL